MDSTDVSRRVFLGSSAGIVVGLSLVHPVAARAGMHPEPTGVVYGRAGERGIPSACAAGPARGEVLLPDGTMLLARQDSHHGIGPGTSVLLSPDGDGGWSVLYAEF